MRATIRGVSPRVNTACIKTLTDTTRILIPLMNEASKPLVTQADRLRWARKHAGFETASAFARLHGLEEPAYRHHENGSRRLRPEVAKKYADLLKISSNWLFWGTGQPRDDVELSPSLSMVVHAPKISWPQAETLVGATPNIDAEEFIPVTYHRTTVIALDVQGDSMNRLAGPGDVIIVDYDDKALVDGRYYVVRATGGMTFKRYRANGGPIRLEPHSTNDHPTIYPAEGELTVIGRVVFVVKRT